MTQPEQILMRAVQLLVIGWPETEERHTLLGLIAEALPAVPQHSAVAGLIAPARLFLAAKTPGQRDRARIDAGTALCRILRAGLVRAVTAQVAEARRMPA
jgi:hypothetical protein